VAKSLSDWRTTGRKTLVETPVFSLRRDRKERLGAQKGPHDFYILESVDWVNVIPLTESGEVVFIELHRHGTDETSLEIPGGMIDPEDSSPMAAAAREMEEETGYRAESLLSLGVVHPNPAIQGNRCYSFLARDVRLAGPPRPDETEDIEVVRYPLSDVPGLLAAGKITHALVVACFLWYFQHEGGLSP
jgi:ADP-ribose pyrophosphatase